MIIVLVVPVETVFFMFMKRTIAIHSLLYHYVISCQSVQCVVKFSFLLYLTSSWTNENSAIHPFSSLHLPNFKPINVVYFPISRMLRETIPPKILMNLCAAIICLNIVFLVGIDRNNRPYEACQTVAFLLQYFFLATFCWSGVEGYHSSRVLVSPTKAEISYFFTKACLLGWGKFINHLSAKIYTWFPLRIKNYKPALLITLLHMQENSIT